MRFALKLALLALAFALGSAFLGWWSVPAIGVLWGAVAKRNAYPGLTAASAAGLAWAGLLLLVAVRGPMWILADKVGAILAIPGWLFIFITLAFPTLLAGTAAVVGEATSNVMESR